MNTQITRLETAGAKNKHLENISEQAIEVFAKSFFNEASTYGFRHLDYLRFVNQLLDFVMAKKIAKPGAKGKHGNLETTKFAFSKTQTKLPIVGDRIIIRNLQTERDRATIKDWLKEKEGRHFLQSRTTSKTMDFDDLVDMQTSTFSLITLSNGTPIGSMAFLDHDSEQNKAELRKLIGEPMVRERGLAKEASYLWIRYGIEVIGLKKIYLNTLNTNIRNIKLNEELGFKFEGVLRREVYFDNEFHDVLRMSLLSD